MSNDFDGNHKSAQKQLDKARVQVASTLQLPHFDLESPLQAVNAARTTLGGQPLQALRSADLKAALPPPVAAPKVSEVSVGLVKRHIDALRNALSTDNQARLVDIDRQLRGALEELRADPIALRNVQRRDLFQLGISLIDESGSCPLCDTQWPPGELDQCLQQKLTAAEAAAQQDQAVRTHSDPLREQVSIITTTMTQVITAARTAQVKQDTIVALNSLLADLKALNAALANPVAEYFDDHFPPARVAGMLAPPNLSSLFDNVLATISEKYPETTPGQTAWDTLTTLEQNLKSLEDAQGALDRTDLLLRRATLLHDSFLKARDTVLSNLYNDVGDRFVQLYRHLHRSDEDSFAAQLQPKGAGLQFQVDFYGRGMHPPQALHSEGHQDSMGLCLYLALAEQLNRGFIDLIILDDVIMSVDAQHRKDLCTLLTAEFSGFQFLITTHDRTWANQLKSEGIVTSKNLVEFYTWHIDTGPRVRDVPDMWCQIAAYLDSNDVPAAAALLRRGSEQFYAEVCDALQAKVRFKLDGQSEFGDLVSSAMHTYSKLLKKAKATAQTRGAQQIFETLEELDSTRKQIYSRVNVEQWAINPSVHYNNWADFTPEDFRPVADAFQDLSSLFVCAACSGLLQVARSGETPVPVAVKCRCGAVCWTL